MQGKYEALIKYGHQVTDPELKAQIAQEIKQITSGSAQTVPPALKDKAIEPHTQR